jgi:hypothetical protein
VEGTDAEDVSSAAIQVAKIFGSFSVGLDGWLNSVVETQRTLYRKSGSAIALSPEGIGSLVDRGLAIYVA